MPGSGQAGISGQGGLSGQGMQTGQHGMDSGQGSGLPMNLGGSGQMNYGSGTSSVASNALQSSLATNIGNVGSMSMTSSASLPGAPPPYDTGSHSFGGLGGGSGMRGGIGGVSQPVSSVIGGGGGGSISSSLYSDPMQNSQAGPNVVPAAKPAPNLEAARYVSEI